MSLLLKHIASGGGINADQNTTDQNDTLTAAASLAIQSSLAITDQNDTLTASASLSALSAPAGKIKKRLDLTQYNQYVLRKMLEDEAEEIEEERKEKAEKPPNVAPLGIFEPVATIEAAMPRVIDTLVSQGAEDVIPLLRTVYGEMLKKAKAEAIELEDIEILLLAA